MQDNTPTVKLSTTDEYEKDLKKIGKKYKSVEKDIEDLIEKLETGETPGDSPRERLRQRISGNKYAVYKVRVRNSNINKGKSGGYRVIYYTVTPEAVLLTAIYSKSVQENISNEEIEARIERYELEVKQQEQSDSDLEVKPTDSAGDSNPEFSNIQIGFIELGELSPQIQERKSDSK
jgi:mRNA-degrading endonuclease RelE of RelBE toxin-antitoxin system